MLTPAILDAIARAIGNNKKLTRLGLELGIEQQRVSDFISQNYKDGQVGNSGTSAMLSAWKEVTPSDSRVGNLWAALVKAELGAIAEDNLIQH